MDTLEYILQLDLLPFILLGAVLLLILVSGYYFLFLRKSVHPSWVKKTAEKFRLLQLQEKDRDRRLVVIDYDKFLTYTLKQKYASNLSLGELLKKYKHDFPKQQLNEIWLAHKLRNKLVHDIDYKPDPNDLSYAIIILKKTIKSLLE